MVIRVTVWGENVHEQKNKVVAQVYPKTMHGTIAEALNRDTGFAATTVTLQDPEQTLTDKVIDGTMSRLMQQLERQLGAVVRR